MKKVILASSFVAACAVFFGAGLYYGGLFDKNEQVEDERYVVSQDTATGTKEAYDSKQQKTEPTPYTPQPSTATLDEAALIGMCTHVMRSYPRIYSEFIMPLYRARGNVSVDQRALESDIASLERAYSISMNSLGAINSFALHHDEAYRQRFNQIAGDLSMGDRLVKTMSRTPQIWVNAVTDCYNEVR